MEKPKRRRSWAEPFKIKSVEILRMTTREEREKCIAEAGSGDHNYPRLELVRLTIPRCVYTQAHMDVVGESVMEVYDQRESVRGLKMVYEPKFLRFFQARFEKL